MMTWFKRLAFVAAILFLVGTLVNASWLAPKPKGALKPIAMGGLGQIPVDDGEACSARIEPPAHRYLANTVPGIARAARLGAPMIAVDVVATTDGRFALFGDARLECLTDGSGDPAALTLAQLQALDAAYRYSADGETFPLRGTGVGAIPALEDALAAAGRARLLYRLRAGEPGDAARLVAALRAAGRTFEARGDAFTGDPAQVARVRALLPEAWTFTVAEAQACTSGYKALGWSGYVPESCGNGTVLVPIDGQFAFWGWPNRMIARMEAANARIVMTGPNNAAIGNGLDLPEQLGEIPADFNGYAFVDDGLAVIPALTPRFDDRTQAEIDAVYAALEQRRADR